jgi:eukaryotic-like serine/threonine-protein kinase
MSEEFPGYTLFGPVSTTGAHRLYAAESNKLARPCVIKSLKPGTFLDTPLAKGLAHEAKILSKLSHPNIVTLLDFHHEGRPFLVLERLEGETLKSVLVRRLRLGIELATAILLELLAGCAYLHKRGFVHRDIKPANIFLDRSGALKLIDFGSASEIGRAPVDRGTDRSQSRRKAQTVGTPAYMSPEQQVSDVATPQSDLFTVGVIAYEMLTGKRPFEDASSHASVVPLRKRVRDIPVELEEVILLLLERNPVDRLPDADAALEACEKILRARTRQKRSEMLSLVFEQPGIEPQKYVPERPSVDVFRGFALIGLSFLVLAAVLQFFVPEERALRSAGGEVLPLQPENAAKLRVLATPWAEIWIDGEYIETTPLAKAIPLKPGVHFVSFRHPNAKAEERKITVAKGELVTLDVSLVVGDDPDAGAQDAQAPQKDAEPSRNPDEPRKKSRK